MVGPIPYRRRVLALLAFAMLQLNGCEMSLRTVAISTSPTPAPSVLTSFEISGLGATTAEGPPISLTLTAKDQYGNVFSGYQSTATLTVSDPSVILPNTTATFNSGVATTKAYFLATGAKWVRATATGAPTVSVDGNSTVVNATAALWEATLYGAPDGYKVWDNSADATIQDSWRGAAIQSDDKVFVVGYTFTGTYRDTIVARIKTDGTLDAAFAGGFVVSRIGSGHNRSYAALVQADGKLVAGGTGRAPANTVASEAFGLVRYLSNGTLDNSFGSSGIALLDIGPHSDWIYALAQQTSDGKIVAAGRSKDAGGTREYAAVARVTTSGGLDNPAFNSTGYNVLSAQGTQNDAFQSVAVQGDGKIVAVGYAQDSVSVYRTLIARFNADGTLDNTFASSGILLYSGSFLNSRGYQVKIQSTGRILVIGAATRTADNVLVSMVLGLNASGGLDPTFANGGLFTDQSGAYGSAALAAVLQSNDKLVIAGFAPTDAIPTDYGGFYLRLNAVGTLDTGFANQGRHYLVKGSVPSYYSLQPQAIAQQSDGKIVSVGDISKASPWTSTVSSDFFWHRLNVAP